MTDSSDPVPTPPALYERALTHIGMFGQLQEDIERCARRRVEQAPPEFTAILSRYLNRLRDDERVALAVSMNHTHGHLFDDDSFRGTYASAKSTRDKIAHHFSFASHEGLFISRRQDRGSPWIRLRDLEDEVQKTVWLMSCVGSINLRQGGMTGTIPEVKEWSLQARPLYRTCEEHLAAVAEVEPGGHVGMFSSDLPFPDIDFSHYA